jgi:hypothetical protein
LFCFRFPLILSRHALTPTDPCSRRVCSYDPRGQPVSRRAAPGVLRGARGAHGAVAAVARGCAAARRARRRALFAACHVPRAGARPRRVPAAPEPAAANVACSLFTSIYFILFLTFEIFFTSSNLWRNYPITQRSAPHLAALTDGAGLTYLTTTFLESSTRAAFLSCGGALPRGVLGDSMNSELLRSTLRPLVRVLGATRLAGPRFPDVCGGLATIDWRLIRLYSFRCC